MVKCPTIREQYQQIHRELQQMEQKRKKTKELRVHVQADEFDHKLLIKKLN